MLTCMITNSQQYVVTTERQCLYQSALHQDTPEQAALADYNNATPHLSQDLVLSEYDSHTVLRLSQT